MDKIKTHQDGLDGVLGGGIPKNHVVLMAGAPGTMKSSLSYAILHENAVRGIPGLYVSLEQGRESLLYQMSRLGYEDAETGEGLCILDLATLRTKIKESDTPWLDFFKMYAAGMKKTSDFRLLVLDSLDALEILTRMKSYRKDVFDLFRWLRDIACTSIVIGELPSTLQESPDDREHPGFSRHREDFLADGVIYMKVEKQGEFGMQRRLRVVKMRGAKHNTSFQAFVFDKGFRVTQILS